MSLTININSDDFTRILSSKFTTDEQKLFVDSFKNYLQYGSDNTKFVINLNDVWNWVGFSTKSNAIRLLKNFFIEGEHYSEESGEFNKSIIMMTVNTFKKFCIKANTHKSDEIADYYIKMENALHEYMETLIKKSNTEVQLLLLEQQSNIELERHNILKTTYDKKPVVYFLKLMDKEDGTFILKIGYTNDLSDRVSKIKYDFKMDSPVLLDVFVCEENDTFETFLHNHHTFLRYKYKDVFNPLTKGYSTETYLIPNQDVYNSFKRIASNHVKNFQGKSMASFMNKLLYLYTSNKDEFNEFCKAASGLVTLNIAQMVEPAADNKDEIGTCDFSAQKKKESMISNQVEVKVPKINSSQGPRVQMYDPESLELVNTFESITDAVRAVNGASFTSIKKASQQKKVHNNYRWHLVARSDTTPVTKPRDIGPTTNVQSRNKGHIAVMNESMDIIQQVFNTQLEVATLLGQCVSAVCNAIKYKTKLSGKYIIYWNELPESVRTAYLSENTLPVPEKRGKGYKVLKIDPDTDKVIESYPSISDLIRVIRVSARTIKTVAANNALYGGYKWRLE